jgi:hypothetical protein
VRRLAALAALALLAGCGGSDAPERPAASAPEAAPLIPRSAPPGAAAAPARRPAARPRTLARRDGFLTRPSRRPARQVALSFVRRNAAALGLREDDLEGLELARSYSSGAGVRHLLWAQTFDGVPAVDGELRANVTADGRLISLGGVPRPGLAPATTTPRLSEARGAATAAAAVGAAPGQVARSGLAVFGGPGAGRLAWRSLVIAPDGAWDVIVDAADGHTLRAHDLRLDASALVHQNHPGAAAGGVQQPTILPPAWLDSTTRLHGPNAWAFSDPGDTYNDYFGGVTPAAGDEIPPSAGDAWSYTQDRRPAAVGQSCPPGGCTWDRGNGAFPWTVNRAQAGTQLFWFVNSFHDHLRHDPSIAFDTPSGAMEGGDRVLAEVDDGAAIDNCAYLNNASMTVPPDGWSPLLETYLWTSACPGSGGINDVNGADDAHVVYHEYAHGLSFRLVTDASGVGALLGDQSGAMGEGISDWYAMDYLVAAGLVADSAASGELTAGDYLIASGLRSEPFDCPVNSTGPACPGTPGAGSGGYTYGDFGKVYSGGPEVHADGEIWAQTLWDLRRALVAAHGPSAGVSRARAYVTDGLRMSPAYPTFLEMRDAILQGVATRGGADRDLVWAVFAARGMGPGASTEGDSDVTPTEDFGAPPPLPVAPPPPPPRVVLPPPPDRTAPVVLEFTATAKRFRVGSPRGGFRFRLTEGATVTIGIARALAGRRSGGSCRPPTHRLRRKPRCTRHVSVGKLVRAGLAPGARRVAFSGRIGGSALRPGAYRARIYARDAAANRSALASARFEIVRRR